MALRELLRSARLRGRALFRRAQLDRDLEDEVHFHLEARASSYRSGFPRRRRARPPSAGSETPSD